MPGWFVDLLLTMMMDGIDSHVRQRLTEVARDAADWLTEHGHGGGDADES